MKTAGVARAMVLGNRTDQAIRISRLLFATSTYLFGAALAGYGIRHHLIAEAGYGRVMACAILINLVFYALIRLGWNLRMRDPSLTLPQIAIATAVNTYLVFHAGQARGALLMGYALILVFGIFRLKWQQLLCIGSAVVAAYGAIILYEVHSARPGLNLPLEILQLLILCFIYPWFALVGAYVGKARERHRAMSLRLQRTIDENMVTLALVKNQASYDELTGIFNRRSIMDALRHAHRRAQTHAAGFCIFLMDIDYFKAINDTAGHLVGDRVLALCAQAIAAQIRPADSLGRWGGEEFLLVMPITRSEFLEDVARRVHAALEAVDLSGVGLPDDARLTISIGSAIHQNGESVEELLAAADAALYRAKANGRDRTEFRDPPDPRPAEVGT